MRILFGLSGLANELYNILAGTPAMKFDPRQTGQQQATPRQQQAQQAWSSFKPIYTTYPEPPVERSKFDDGDVIDIEPEPLKQLGE